MLKSPKTTITGVLGILVAVLSAVLATVDGDATTNADWPTVIAAVTTGLGLIFARDNGVTSKQAGAEK